MLRAGTVLMYVVCLCVCIVPICVAVLFPCGQLGGWESGVHVHMCMCLFVWICGHRRMFALLKCGKIGCETGDDAEASRGTADDDVAFFFFWFLLASTCFLFACFDAEFVGLFWGCPSGSNLFPGAFPSSCLARCGHV
jgi:hypothetical protein